MKPSIMVTVVFLLLVALAHLLRLIFQTEVTINAVELPMWPSVVACIATAILALWLLRENKKR
jgi:uncharacterized membrane protein